MKMLAGVCVLLGLGFAALGENAGPADPPIRHKVLAVGNDKLMVFSMEGKVEWEMPWKGGSHDLWVMENGNYLAIRNAKELVEIDPKMKKEVWSYNAAESNGNSGKPMEVHACQPLPGETFMVAESGPGRIIEIDRAGKLLKSIALKVNTPNPHRDTRLARKLERNGHYLVCHEGDGMVKEYDGEGAVVWAYAVPLFDHARADGHGPEAFGNQAFSALRLVNGNTLIGCGNGHALLEVDPDQKIVWELHQNDVPGVTLAWVTTLSILPNDHIVFGNCHAGAGQPQLIEIADRGKAPLWMFEHFDVVGNDMTNSVLLELSQKTRR